MCQQPGGVDLNVLNVTFVSLLADKNQADLWSLFKLITTFNGTTEMIQQTTIEMMRTTSTRHTEWLELLTSGFWHILLKLRFLFYLVWPTDTMFSSLEQVPRYVTEVSSWSKCY